FVAVLSGFTPTEKIALRLATSEATPRILTIPAITIDGAGGYTLAIPALGLTGGDYTLAALRGAEVVASARFTVVAAPRATPTRPAATPTRPAPTQTRSPIVGPTAAPALPTPPSTGSGGFLPGLPNTGGGAGGGLGGTVAPLLVALSIPLATLALVQRRRKRYALRRITNDREQKSGPER
ncbi:MAG TPA: hypothetical protein VIL85_12090, partial [Thermomicrobiales bacterium]